MSELSHIDSKGNATMVDISLKPAQIREAEARGKITMQPETLLKINLNGITKGDVFAVARIAGIQAAKGTSSLIPLCHTIMLSHVSVDFEVTDIAVEVRCVAKSTGSTGVEMEALTGVSVALLTIYDMCKAIDKAMNITDIHLVNKTKR